MNDFRYQYPNDLGAKLMVVAWTVPELIGIGFFGIIMLLVALNFKSVIPIVLVAGAALFTAHFDERSVVEHLYDWIKFLSSPRSWQYMPDAQLNVPVSSATANKPKKKKKTSFAPPIIAAVLCVAFVVGVSMIPSTDSSEKPKATATPKATEVANPEATASTQAEVSASPEASAAPAAVSNATVTFNEETMTLPAGNDLDSSSNVLVAENNAELEEVDDDNLENGQYYIDDSQVDTNTPGNYQVTVHVKDNEGTESTSSFNVVIE